MGSRGSQKRLEKNRNRRDSLVDRIVAGRRVPARLPGLNQVQVQTPTDVNDDRYQQMGRHHLTNLLASALGILRYVLLHLHPPQVPHPHDLNGHFEHIRPNVRLQDDQTVQTTLRPLRHHNKEDLHRCVKHHFLQSLNQLGTNNRYLHGLWCCHLLVCFRVDAKRRRFTRPTT